MKAQIENNMLDQDISSKLSKARLQLDLKVDKRADTFDKDRSVDEKIAGKVYKAQKEVRKEESKEEQVQQTEDDGKWSDEEKELWGDDGF